ncbi:MAG TPA: DUF4136 domain-containing protein [Allosphingosinicella sp.]|nr:DUF4136 domain-containing protein [Allosphingosinicella sp.]
MSLAKKFLILAAPAAALLALGGCATGLPTQVSRYQAMPAPQGQTFAIRSADPADRGGLEFARYADLVRRHLTEIGYREAVDGQGASLIVSLDYGVDDGKQQIVDWGPRFGGFGRYGGYYGPYGLGRRYRGYGSPFYWGWNDPFYFGRDIDVYTVYTSFLDLDIKRAGDGQSVFEGTARARSRSDDLRDLVPALVEAMFTRFPGNSGETVRITVAPERKR